MEKLIEMLEDLNPDVDFSTEEKLIDGGLLDSMAILSLVSDLEDEFDVEITPVELVPANFKFCSRYVEYDPAPSGELIYRG